MQNEIIPIPEKMEILHEGFHMIIRRKWFSPIFIFLTVFVILWNGFLVFWYGLTTELDAPLVFQLFPIIHVAVGLGLTYYTIAGYINKTDIKVSNSKIQIKSYPLPWLGDKIVESQNITQLYTKQVVSRGKNGTSVTFEVHLVDKAGKQKRLIRGLTTIEQGLFIESEIEEYLNIEDRPVAGEA